jgi:hypothetical protein
MAELVASSFSRKLGPDHDCKIDFNVKLFDCHHRDTWNTHSMGSE